MKYSNKVQLTLGQLKRLIRESKRPIKQVTASKLKGDVEWLKEQGTGCCHRHLWTDDEGNRVYVVVGWTEHFGGEEEGLIQAIDGSTVWTVCARIGYQTKNSAMQTDMDLDFPMPYNPDTGDCWDYTTPVREDEDYEWLANYLNRNADELYDAVSAGDVTITNESSEKDSKTKILFNMLLPQARRVVQNLLFQLDRHGYDDFGNEDTEHLRTKLDSIDADLDDVFEFVNRDR